MRAPLNAKPAFALLLFLIALVPRISSGYAPAPPPALQANTPDVHVGRGYDAVKDERYEKAAAEFQTALALDPRLDRARYQLALCYLALGRLQDARKEFKRVQRDRTGDSAVTYYLGRLDLLDHNPDSAINRLQSVVDRSPFPDTAYYLGTAYLQKGDLSAAEEWLRKAAELSRRDFRVPDHLARVCQKLNRPLEAEAMYARSAELRQHYNEATTQSIQCSRELETRPLAEARTTCQKLNDPEDPDKLTTLGMIYGQHGDYAEAVVPLERAVQLDPESSEIQHNLGLTYFRLRRYAEARGPLEKAVGLRPDFFGSNALLGATLFALSDDEAAYRALDHAHRLNPLDADSADLLFRSASLLAQGRMLKKDYRASLGYLRRAAELRPQDAATHRRMAEVYRLAGDQTQSERETREAARLGGK
jgi:tetratricopeptide (TPR) repeat protein